MISIDCSKSLAIKDQLLEYVADKIKALPILKSEKILLTSIDDNQNIDKLDVLDAISEFLESVNLKENFKIIPKDDDLKIEPLDGTDMKEKLEKISEKNKNPFLECTHCGFMTMYEEELTTHRLIHYI